MAIKERKQLTGTTTQINAYAGHEGQIVWDKTKKTLVGLSGTAGTNYPLATSEEVTKGLNAKANTADVPSVAYSTTDLTAGTSTLSTGSLYCVYE